MQVYEPIRDTETHHKLAEKMAEKLRHYFMQIKDVPLSFTHHHGKLDDKDAFPPIGLRKDYITATVPNLGATFNDKIRAKAGAALIEVLGEGVFTEVKPGEWQGDAQKVIDAIAQCSAPELLEKYKKYAHRAMLKDRAIMRAPETGASVESHFFANLAANKPTLGQYFDVSRLAEYYEDYTKPGYKFDEYLTNSLQLTSQDDARGREGVLARKVISAIQNFGYNRVALAAIGTNCMALVTPPDVNKKRQIIVVGAHHTYLPHPLILPTKGIVNVGGNQTANLSDDASNATRQETEMQVRVMPYLDTGKATDEDVERLTKICRKARSGLKVMVGAEGSEVKKNNIGILEFNARINGEVKHFRLPYLLDWAIFQYQSMEQVLKLKKENWDKDPELAEYRIAAKYLATQARANQVLSADQREMRLFLEAHGVPYHRAVDDKGRPTDHDPVRMATLMAVYREDKLTPAELKAVAEKTNDLISQYPEFQDVPEVYHYIAHAYATKDMDLSLPHNQTKPLGSLNPHIKRSPDYVKKLIDRAYDETKIGR